MPVAGSPWAFAAEIYDKGDGSFLPTEVEILTPEKAYILGWYFLPDTTRSATSGGDGFQPAEIICDLSNGEVTHAALFVGEENDNFTE